MKIDLEVDAMIWKVRNTEVRGWNDGGIWRVSGLKYANAERHDIPEFNTIKGRAINATKRAAASLQNLNDSMFPFFGGEEENARYTDYPQRLSIHIPIDTKPTDKLPVMVFLHGGSYVGGAGDLRIFDPKRIVREQNVIVVTVTNRLGVLGYLGNDSDYPSNLGLLDQIEALRFVNKYISYFGGDDKNITLFGQSSGADSVMNLMVIDETEGMFQKIIVQSAPFGLRQNRETMSMEMFTHQREAYKDADMNTLMGIQADVGKIGSKYGLNGSMPFGAQYGHHPLPSLKLFDEKFIERAKKVSVMIGSNAREVVMFLEVVPILQRMYQNVVTRVIPEAAIAVLSKRIYGSGAKHYAKLAKNAYLYEISWGARQNPYRASHCIESPLLFGDEDVWTDSVFITGKDWASVEHDGKKLRYVWAEFAKHGTIDVKLTPKFLKVNHFKN